MSILFTGDRCRKDGGWERGNLSYCFAKRGAGIFIGKGLWIVLPDPESEGISMIREGAMDFFYFSFFMVGGGDIISYRKRGSRFFFCLWVPRHLRNH